MAMIVSQTGHEALNFEVGDMQYQHYTGGFYLEIICTVLNPALPEEAYEIGEVLTGPDLGKSLREFDFSKKVFHYAFDFDWENDSDNAGWWIKKKAKSEMIDVEFVFLRTFHLSDSPDDEEKDAVIADILDYTDPIRVAQPQCPGLKLAFSPYTPIGRNGIIGCIRVYTTDMRRLVDRSEFVIAESRARITAERAEFNRFIKLFRQEIHGAEQEFFKIHPEYAPKVRPLPVPEVATTLCDDPYMDHGNGTVTDRRTGLQWMRFSLGQEWQEGTCVGKAKEYKWQKALDAATELNGQGGYAGYADWRIPTIEELQTLIYCSSGQPRVWNGTGMPWGNYERPTIYLPIFPNTPASWYWSSPYEYPIPSAWCIYFRNGYISRDYKKSQHYVRLVRGTKME